jgi:hypothetical protein
VLGSFSGGAGFNFAGEGAPLPDGFDLVGVPGRTDTVAVFAIDLLDLQFESRKRRRRSLFVFWDRLR